MIPLLSGNQIPMRLLVTETERAIPFQTSFSKKIFRTFRREYKHSQLIHPPFSLLFFYQILIVPSRRARLSRAFRYLRSFGSMSVAAECDKKAFCTSPIRRYTRPNS